MKPVDLSVVIVSYNTRDLLATCLASLADSGPEIEIIVVDNASEDRSAAMVLERFSRVRLIQNLHNPGYACASNQGIRASSGRYVLLLNPDTEIRPGALDRVLAFANSCPDLGAVGLQLLNPDGTLQPSGRRFPTLASALGELLPLPERWRRHLRGDLEGRDYSQVCQVDEVSGAAMCLRRAALDQVGLFDEDFFFLGEDIDLCWRLRQAGWTVVYFPEARVVHLWGSSRNKTNPYRVSLLSQRSYYLLFRKHRSRLEALTLEVAVSALALLKLAKWLGLSAGHLDWQQARQVWDLHTAELAWLWRNQRKP